MSGDDGWRWMGRLIKCKSTILPRQYLNKRRKRKGEFETAKRREQELRIIREEATAIATHQAMSTHLIAEVIFEFLTVKDLLQCSVVSKTWNLHARSVLCKKKKSFATFVKMRTPCCDLRNLNTIMSKSVNLPLNGLCIENLWEGQNGHDCLKTEDPLTFNSFMLKSNFKLKYLKVSWRHKIDCPAFAVIGEILEDHSSHLEELTFKIFPDTVSSLASILPSPKEPLLQNESPMPLVQVVPGQIPPPPPPPPGTSWHCVFPRLTKITVPKDPYRIQSSFISDIIWGSPNLERIEGDILPKITEILLYKNKVHTVDSFCFVPSSFEDLKLSINFVRANPKITQLTVLTTKNDITWSADLMPIIRQILRVLYEKNKENLTVLSIAHFDLFFFTGVQMPTMPHLTTLHVKYDRYCDEREGYSTLSRINYAIKFPNLTHLILSQYPTWISTPIENYLDQQFRHDGEAFSCLSVTNLRLVGYAVDCQVIERIVKIFPNVIGLCIEGSWCYPEIFQKLWTFWPNIESITCTHISDKNIWKNFDSVFTGLSEEQCDMLRDTKNFHEMNELTVVNPSIRNLTRLKKLRLHIEHYNSKCKEEENPPNIFLTDVTGQYAFSSMPNLVVEINRNTCIYACDHRDPNQCQLALKSISPFVTFVSYFDFKCW